MATISTPTAMPAVEISFSGDSLPPPYLYLDSDVLVAAVIRTHEHHERSVRLLELLLRSGVTTPCLSPVSWMEFAHVFSKESFRKALPLEFDHLRPVIEWVNPEARERYYEYVMHTLDDLLSPFEWLEIPTTTAVNRHAITLMGRYNMDAQDAIHLASMHLAGIDHLASFDRIFRRVDGLNLWNDQIFGRRPDPAAGT
jgi:predicted nucleic acid-binding protein